MSLNMVDSLPLPPDFGKLHEGDLYIIPPDRLDILLVCCGFIVDGCPRDGINTVAGIFHPVNYESRPFPLPRGGVIRIARRPEGCPGGCSGPCVHRGRYDSENLYHLFNADG